MVACAALFQGVRDPYVILITIYVFVPYFVSAMVGNPVQGQALERGVHPRPQPWLWQLGSQQYLHWCPLARSCPLGRG